MYKMSLYSIYDKAAGTFNAPVCCVSDAVAIRMLRETLADRSTILARYPDDYQLVKIGDFLVENGQINPCANLLVDGFRSLLPDEGGSCGGSIPPQDAERIKPAVSELAPEISGSTSKSVNSTVKSKKNRR